MFEKMYWQGQRTPLAEDNLVVLGFGDEEYCANLPLYLDEVNHSPTGFEWGYAGSGPSQLAYAILRSYFQLSKKMSAEDAERFAKRHYMRFKGAFVGRWGSDEWKITSDQITFWLSTEKEDKESEGWV